MIYLIFLIGFTFSFLLGFCLGSIYKTKRPKKPFRLKKFDDEYKKFLEFDGSL